MKFSLVACISHSVVSRTYSTSSVSGLSPKLLGTEYEMMITRKGR